MKTALLGLILVGVVIVIGINLRTVTPDISQDAPEEGTLLWYVEQAKGKGQKEITMGPSLVDYGGAAIKNLGMALSVYNVILGTPVEKLTLPYSSDNIGTWYKFKSLEVISRTGSATLSEETSALPPDQLLPIAEDEFVVAQIGGSLVIDDVKVIKPFEYPPFEKGEQYLLLVRRSPSGKAEIAGGPIGSFRLGIDGSLIPITTMKHPLIQDLQEHGNSLVRLRAAIRAKS